MPVTRATTTPTFTITQDQLDQLIANSDGSGSGGPPLEKSIKAAN